MEATTGTTPAPERAGSVSAERSGGPVAAALYALGIGSVIYGLLVVLAEASEGIHDKLDFVERVGPLSGKTIVGVIAWLVTWAVLSIALKDKDADIEKAGKVAIVLVIVALVLTFPPFFLLFAPAA